MPLTQIMQSIKEQLVEATNLIEELVIQSRIVHIDSSLLEDKSLDLAFISATQQTGALDKFNRPMVDVYRECYREDIKTQDEAKKQYYQWLEWCPKSDIKSYKQNLEYLMKELGQINIMHTSIQVALREFEQNIDSSTSEERMQMVNFEQAFMNYYKSLSRKKFDQIEELYDIKRQWTEGFLDKLSSALDAAVEKAKTRRHLDENDALLAKEVALVEITAKVNQPITENSFEDELQECKKLSKVLLEQAHGWREYFKGLVDGYANNPGVGMQDATTRDQQNTAISAASMVEIDVPNAQELQNRIEELKTLLAQKDGVIAQQDVFIKQQNEAIAMLNTLLKQNLAPQTMEVASATPGLPGQSTQSTQSNSEL